MGNAAGHAGPAVTAGREGVQSTPRSRPAEALAILRSSAGPGTPRAVQPVLHRRLPLPAMPPIAVRAPTPRPPRSAAAARRRPMRCANAAAGCAATISVRSPRIGQPLDCWIGRVDGLEDVVLPAELAGWDCRNNRLAWLALQHDGIADALDAVVARHGAERIAVVVGTSTSSIGATEEAYARLRGRRRRPAALPRRPASVRSCTRRIRSAISCSASAACAGRASPSPPRARRARRCSRRPRG